MALSEGQNIFSKPHDIHFLPLYLCIQFNVCGLVFSLTQLKKYGLGQVISVLPHRLDELKHCFTGRLWYVLMCG